MPRIAVVVLVLLVAWPASAADISSCFVPGEDCAAIVVAEIGAAKSEVLVQAYSFTSRPIARALADARRRGVDVRAILDRRETTSKGEAPAIDEINRAGVLVLIDGAHAIAHNKVMVIDGRDVITGSFNFTKAANERNAENLLVIADPALAERYRANWQRHAGHSEPN